MAESNDLPHYNSDQEIKRDRNEIYLEEMASLSNQELKQEINQMKKRIAALERAFESIVTKDDLLAIEEAHDDLKHGKTMTLSEAKKKHS